MPWLYTLFSEKDGKFYIGQTERDIHVRVQEHTLGYVKATAPRRPLVLAYAQEFEKAADAKRQEWFLKQPKGYMRKRVLLQDLIMRKTEWPIVETLVKSCCGA